MKRKKFRPFENARSHVWALRIKTQREWQQFCGSGERPSDVPASPDKVYKHLGWVSWGDWLGTGSLSRRPETWWSYEDSYRRNPDQAQATASYSQPTIPMPTPSTQDR